MSDDRLFNQILESNIFVSGELQQSPPTDGLPSDKYTQALETFIDSFLSYLKIFFVTDDEKNNAVIPAHISFACVLEHYYELFTPDGSMPRDDYKSFSQIFKLSLENHLRNNAHKYFSAPHTPNARHLDDVAEMIGDLLALNTAMALPDNASPETFISMYRFNTSSKSRNQNIQQLEILLSQPYATKSQFRFSLKSLNLTELLESVTTILVQCKPLLHAAHFTVPQDWVELLKHRSAQIMESKAIATVNGESTSTMRHTREESTDSLTSSIREKKEIKSTTSTKKKGLAVLLTPLYIAIEVPFVALIVVILMLSMCTDRNSSLYDERGLPVEQCTQQPFC